MHVATERGDRGRTGELVVPREPANDFGVEAVRQCCRRHEVGEQHCFVPATPVRVALSDMALGERAERQRVIVVVVEHEHVLDEIEHFVPLSRLRRGMRRREVGGDEVRRQISRHLLPLPPTEQGRRRDSPAITMPLSRWNP